MVVLPWDDGRRGMRWYVLVDETHFEQVKEELVAHVGVTYTDYRGQASTLESGDPGDIALTGVEAGRLAIRVDLIDGGHGDDVARALGRFLDLWGVRPPPPVPPSRAPAEVLREYRLSLSAGRRQEAEAALTELRLSGDLEVINLRLLGLEIASVFDGPNAVLEHPTLPALLRVRRPARATDLIAQAIDRGRLRPNGEATLEELVRRFGELDPSLRDLITTPGECRSSSGALFLVLRAAKSRAEIMPLIERLNEVVDVDQDTMAILVALAGLSTPFVRDDRGQATLSDLLTAGEYDEVLQRALVGPVTVQTVESALRAAQWLDSIEAGRLALTVLESASREIQSLFIGNRLMAPMVGALRDLVRVEVPVPSVRDWNEFFENLWANPDWEEAVETASHGAIEWMVQPFASDSSAVSRLAGHIARGAHYGLPTFNRVIPLLIQWLDRVPELDRPAVSELDEAVVFQLALEDRTRAGLELLGNFAADLIALGLERSRYRFVLESLEERWNASKSPSSMAWAAEVIEALIDNPCPEPEVRVSFVGLILRTGAEFIARIPVDIRALLENLASELGLRGLLPIAPAQVDGLPQQIAVDGIVVGLYSLTESALKRAYRYLTDTWPGLRVVLRSDEVASDELGNLARTANLMVIASRSAKHAATLFISDRRPATLPTRFASGKGSASLVREVNEWLTSIIHQAGLRP